MPVMSNSEGAFCRSAPWRFAARKLILPWTLMGSELSGSVLELGSGSGAMAAEILDRFPQVRLTATDLDPNMLARSRRTLEPFGSRASVQEADATALPFAPGEFDAVVSYLMLHHVGDWETALAEATRVLKLGGLLLVADLLDNRVVRAGERLAGSEARPIPRPQLMPVLAGLPLIEVDARPVRNSFVRLRAKRAQLPG